MTSEHQCQQALDAEAKRYASRFVHEDRHVTTIHRKLQTLTEQQQAAITNKVCQSLVFFFSYCFFLSFKLLDVIRMILLYFFTWIMFCSVVNI